MKKVITLLMCCSVVCLSDQSPLSLIDCELPSTQLRLQKGAGGGYGDECTHDGSDRTIATCTWADGTECSTHQNIYTYNEGTQNPSTMLGDYTYCRVGAKCVNVDGSKPSDDWCVEPMEPKDGGLSF
jgi:hypothetical protein